MPQPGVIPEHACSFSRAGGILCAGYLSMYTAILWQPVNYPDVMALNSVLP
jgi:hypothetical protein